MGIKWNKVGLEYVAFAFIKMPVWCKNESWDKDSGNIKITIQKGIFNEDSFTATFWAFNRGVSIIKESENIKHPDTAIRITEERITNLFIS